MRTFIFLIFILFSCAAGRAWNRFFNRELRIYFFDVGQGDSALIHFPGGKTLLIDAGGGSAHWNVGSRELFPELARLGILRLDAALLSHADQDHGFGFQGIFEEMGVNEFWINSILLSTKDTRPLFSNLKKLAEINKVAIRAIDRRQTLIMSDVKITLIPLGNAQTSSNDRSLVAALEFAGCKALFTGDIDASAELEIGLDQVSLLKVAHHGSRTSSSFAFLRKAKPRWSVISVGNNNHYGHPHRETLDRLKRVNTQIFRTDFHGFVEFRISPNGAVSCRNALGDCGKAWCRSVRPLKS